MLCQYSFRLFPSSFLTVGLCLLFGCGTRTNQARPPLSVSVAPVLEETFTPSIEVVSRLSSTKDVDLRPEVDGRVVEIRASQGQRVKAGETILVLDNVQEAAALDSSRAEARKDYVNAERYIFLNQQGAVSTKDRDFYVTQAIESRDQARAKAASLDYKYVRAPIDGEIGDLDSVKLGDYVRQGQAITGIVDNSILWTLIDVPASQADLIRVGQSVVLRSQSDPPVTGKGEIVFISPYFGHSNNQSSPNTVRVKAQFPNLTGQLKTGQFVTNTIITGSTSQLAIPVQAVMMQAQQPFVYRVVPLSSYLEDPKTSKQLSPKRLIELKKFPSSTSIVLQTPVKLGRLEDDQYPLLSGLKKGDRVVVSNTALLRSGLPIRIANRKN